MAITAVPLAQWLFDEAASGDAVTNVEDNITSPAAVSLIRTAGSGTGAWGIIGAGRGYDFSGATSGFYFSRGTAGTKLAISGKKKIATQLVFRYTTTNGAFAPVIGVGEDGQFLIRFSGITTEGQLRFIVNDTAVRTLGPGGFDEGTVYVLTFVNDTTQAAANDRHRIYLGTSSVGTVLADVAQDVDLASWSGIDLYAGDHVGGGFQWNGALAYLAIYVDGEVDTLVAELAEHVAALEADNDVAPGAGGGGQQPEQPLNPFSGFFGFNS